LASGKKMREDDEERTKVSEREDDLRKVGDVDKKEREGRERERERVSE